MAMNVDTIIESPLWEPVGLPSMADVAAQATLGHLGYDPERYEICVMGCDDARIAELNGDFRAKPQPTNVLSWPSEERANPGKPPIPPNDPELGDIAIAFETCKREAKDQNKVFNDHVTHLLVHGVLHLLGYDHMTQQDAAIMEALEVEILANLGIADPY